MSSVGSAEEIGKLSILQELVRLWARAISDRIVSGSSMLVWVANFDDTVLGFIRGNFVNVYFDNPDGSGTPFA